MNINETKQALSYIYSTHPHAPKLTHDDKTRMVYAYFRVLYKYDLQDVLNAIDSASRESAFCPSAYDIERHMEISINPADYLPDNYKGFMPRMNLYSEINRKVLEYYSCEEEHDKKQLYNEIERLQNCIDEIEFARKLWIFAESKATKAYYDKNISLAASDMNLANKELL